MKKRFYHNFRLTMLLLLLPLSVGVFAIYYILGGSLTAQLGGFGNNRLITEGWQTAYAYFTNSQPDYGPRNSYYKLKPGQDLDWVAQHFSVDRAKLQQLNPGIVAYGTTVAIPPVEKPLEPFGTPSGNLKSAIITDTDGLLQISNDFRNSTIRTTIPELAELLAPYGAITRVAEKHYRINRPIVIEGDIRLDITNDTVSRLELASLPNFANTCLCFENAEALIRNTVITSFDSTTGQPDYIQDDGRSFIRALKSTRMDVIDSDISYLGTSLQALMVGREQLHILRSGGAYGISWRINKEKLGEDIVTGWVEGSTFQANYFGAYTFGASGMVWRNNLFTSNEVYGLDPHDDSNNMLIENNRFTKNGKHGFIVSKRCNYNVIRNNISTDNKGHGYMLHEDSNYNLLENNIASGNTDNFVIFGSSDNTIRGNKSYNALSSHVRINAKAKHNYIEDNFFYGGNRGVYLYDGADGVLVHRNVFSKNRSSILATDQAMRVVFTNNQIDGLSYKLADGDRVVFGSNRIKSKPVIDLAPLSRLF